ncbi:MAG: hypothetical protein IT373_08315 [Polyangiaceae bacterium]|nr:hypothetical protein [Polyangiaceae bacterium]
MAELTPWIEAGSPQAAVVAERMGPEGRAPARAALGSPRAEVRRVAIHCLAAIGEGQDLPAVAALVADGDRAVAVAATAAVRELHRGSLGQGRAVLATFDATADPELRAELALALGEGVDVPVDVLRARHAAEKSPLVKGALSAACAKRGAAPHLRALSVEIGRAKAAAKVEVIERAVYVRRSELLPALLALFGDATHLMPGWPEGRSVRVCDQAAWAVAEIVGGHFAAEDRAFAGLTAGELDEVRARAEEALKA